MPSYQTFVPHLTSTSERALVSNILPCTPDLYAGADGQREITNLLLMVSCPRVPAWILSLPITDLDLQEYPDSGCMLRQSCLPRGVEAHVRPRGVSPYGPVVRPASLFPAYSSDPSRSKSTS